MTSLPLDHPPIAASAALPATLDFATSAAHRFRRPAYGTSVPPVPGLPADPPTGTFVRHHYTSGEEVGACSPT